MTYNVPIHQGQDKMLSLLFILVQFVMLLEATY